MSGFDPTVDEVCQRVWEGRSAIRARGPVYLSDEIEVVVSNEIWAKLMIAFREAESKWLSALQYRHGGTSSDDGSRRATLWLFGIPVRVSNDLEPHEVRFRAEVSV